MSITIDYFFNYPKSLTETMKDINTWIGCSLSPYNGDALDLYCRFLGMEFSFREHTFENDQELDFENFRYKIGIRTPVPEAHFRPIQMPVMAFLVFALYRKLGITGILVYDCQILLGRYIQNEHPQLHTPALFDLLSNKFVEFPQHLTDLSALLPDNNSLLNWEQSVSQYLESQGRKVEQVNEPRIINQIE